MHNLLVITTLYHTYYLTSTTMSLHTIRHPTMFTISCRRTAGVRLLHHSPRTYTTHTHAHHNQQQHTQSQNTPLHNRFAIVLLTTAVSGAILYYTTIPAVCDHDDVNDSSVTQNPATTQHRTGQPPQQTEKSEQPNSDPRYPHIIRLVADTIDPLIYRSDNGMLVDVYEESCGACKQTAPILHLVAKCLRQAYRKQNTDPSKALQVGMFESNKNYKRGFLTADEEIAVPTIKLFVKHLTPQQVSEIEQKNKSAKDRYDTVTVQQHPNNTVSLTYNGPPQAKALLEFLHKYTAGSKHEFDLNTALECVKKNDQTTYNEVMKQSQARIADDPTAFLYDNSPCGPHFQTMLLRTMTHSYLSYPSSDDNRATALTFENLTNCLTTKKKQTQDYWSTVAAVAQQNLADIDERDRLDHEAVSNKTKKKKKSGKLNADEDANKPSTQ